MNVTRQLVAYGRKPPTPLTVPLEAGSELQITQWLRILPGKRLVGCGEWQGQLVLVKLFIASAARRHWQRELNGVKALREQQLQTPELLASGALPGGGFYLITRYLEGARSLQQNWQALPDTSPANPDARAIVQRVLRALAQLHRHGLTQSDLHLGNFLCWQDDLYIIDGDAIQQHSPGEPITAAEAAHNLGLFFAQLVPAWDEQVELMLIDYLSLNSERALNPEQIQQSIDSGRAWRLRDYLGKAVRDCTLFSVRQNWWRFLSVQRKDSKALTTLLAAPDEPFTRQPPALKDGGSSTVTRVSLADRELVIKRYNIKSLAHWLRRFWRPSRAWHSWLAGHHLRFLDIATPEPLAMLESRFGPFRRRAWLVTAFCPGQDLCELVPADGSCLPSLEQQSALLALFTQLQRHQISHGDCKGTNILWAEGCFWLIDLDAMQAHQRPASWQQAWARDRARLIRNWPADSQMACWLEQALPNLSADTGIRG
ncbi:lipopolysaccharide kinase InaA family protein [Halopseudomonas salegens]|uniref:Lipopolysaccharide kinase (Kdo/WaaP) family protein n=1 Tax=Halopseudomonas salegens TaxID=1434072 RepID=A0A1H2EHD1_9GAMM|nr:lipopolysaccharide kinase InaA family protein [Halopseudomonas salegens]SDT94108.1 Lipopolysaccharide kinase (Kdo/WaaP) family protein [Halopseudomonas salegens]